MFRLALFAGLVAYVAAQSFSTKCQSALTTIALNPAASQCLAISSLVPVITAGSNTSLVQPLNNWLGNMCSAPACNNATIAAVVTNLTAGCSTEFNISSTDTTLIPTVQSLYPSFRKTLCLKHGNVLCLTETLTNVETITGPLTLDNIAKISQNPPSSLPANITCTDCNKATYSIWAKDFPSSSAVASSKSSLESQCGASFVDGSTPSSISQSASTSVGSPSLAQTGAAFSLLETLTNSLVLAIGASGFVTLSTVCAILI